MKMPYVQTDQANTWTAQEHLLTCPEIVQIASGDTPYVGLDFSRLLNEDVAVSAVATPTEQNGKTITFGDVQVSNNRSRVSFRVTGNNGPDDYLINVRVTKTDGTTNTLTRRCTLRVL